MNVYTRLFPFALAFICIIPHTKGKVIDDCKKEWSALNDPNICIFSQWNKSFTCSQLGMVPNDYDSRKSNTRLLVQAINEGYKIICDGLYFVSGNNGGISNSINISGRGGFVFEGPFTIVNNIQNIILKDISFMSYNIYLGNEFDNQNITAFYFPKKGENKYRIDQVSVKNCKIDNISLIRFHNRTGDHIKRVDIEGNDWRNMTYVGVAIGSTGIDKLSISNNNAYKVKSRLFDFTTATKDYVKSANIVHNYLSNEGYISNTTEFYAGFAVLECIDCIYESNVVENFLLANESVNLYDLYCNCRKLTYINNRKLNVINFRDVNQLCKAKGFVGDHGCRIVENNSFIIDDSVINQYAHLISDKCSVRLMELSPNEDYVQDRLSIKNNYIKADVPCCFGMSNNTIIKDVIIQNNTIDCNSIAKGDYFFRGRSDNVIISNNQIHSKQVITTNTPAVSLKSGKYRLDDCFISAFPGAISPDVESVVSNCSITFTYQPHASTHLVLGGSVERSMINFQRYDLSDSYNIYIDKASNGLSLHDLVFEEVPSRGTLWFRYLLDANRSADFLIAELKNKDNVDSFIIDNINHRLITSNRLFEISDTKQVVREKLTVVGSIAFYGDRFGISGIPEGMTLSIQTLSKSAFDNLLRQTYSIE